MNQALGEAAHLQHPDSTKRLHKLKKEVTIRRVILQIKDGDILTSKYKDHRNIDLSEYISNAAGLAS